MFRKLSLAAAAALSLGFAALAPTSASAWDGGWHGGFHPGYHAGFYHRPYGWGYGPRVYVGGPAYGYGYGGRLLCPAAGSDPLGAALALGEPLLLINRLFEAFQKPRLRAGVLLLAPGARKFHTIFTRISGIPRRSGNNLAVYDLVPSLFRRNANGRT